MPEADQRRIDPRYDAAFQRGYADPAAPESSPTSSPASSRPPSGDLPGRRPAPESRLVSPASRAADAGGAAAAATTSRIEGRRTESAQPAPDPRAHPELLDDEGDDLAPRRNPYELALLVLGIVLVVAPAALINASRGLFLDAPQDEFQYWMLTLAGTVAPAVLAVGLLTLIALLFLRARDWSARR